jgi:hypothetical protein
MGRPLSLPPYSRTSAIPLFFGPVFLFLAPVIRLFSERAFSLAISRAFPVFRAHRRPVNRLYFFNKTFWRALGGRKGS